MLMCLHPESDPQLSRLAEADNARESLHANQVHKKLVYQPEMRNTDYWHPLSKASFFFFFHFFLKEFCLTTIVISPCNQGENKIEWYTIPRGKINGLKCARKRHVMTHLGLSYHTVLGIHRAPQDF